MYWGFQINLIITLSIKDKHNKLKHNPQSINHRNINGPGNNTLLGLNKIIIAILYINMLATSTLSKYAGNIEFILLFHKFYIKIFYYFQ